MCIIHSRTSRRQWLERRAPYRKGYRECHVFPDLLLVYKRLITGELLILTVYRIDSHTNIFDINKSQKKK